ncbi:MAG: nuclear transport factor 2 family protein [Polyangiales bacterium]
MTDISGVLHAYADAWMRGDVSALAALYDDDFTLHYPGEHPLAGVHRGKPAALRVLAEVSRRVRRRLLRVTDVMSGAQRGALQVVEEWTREGETMQLDRVLVYTVRDGRLTACWLFDADARAVARFLRDAAT